MTSKELSEKLAAAGVSIAAATIRKDWSAGAPRSSPEAFMRWRAKNIAADTSDLAALRREKIEKQIAILEQRRIAEERANDVARQALVERAWVAARIQAAAHAIKAYYLKAVQEHPIRIAAAGGDVSRVRETYKEAWDDIFRALHELSTHFDETHEKKKLTRL